MVFNEFLIGKRERMSWIAETSYGSGGTMTGGEVVGTNCVISPNFGQGYQEVITAGADDRYVQNYVSSVLVLPYTMTFNPVNWKFLKYIMGCVDAGGGPYTHTFTPSNTVLSYKLEWAKRATTSVVDTLTGNIVKSYNVSFARVNGEGREGFLTVSAECVAKAISSGSSVTTLSGGNITADPFQFRHAKLTLDGDEIVELNSGNILVENGINEEDSRYCNATLDKSLGEPIPKVFRISGTFNVNVKDSTYATLWSAAAAVSGTTKLEFIKDTNDKIVFTFTNFFIDSGIAPTNLDGVTSVDIVWKALSFTSVVATDSISTY